jgi:hypothetical protein
MIKRRRERDGQGINLQGRKQMHTGFWWENQEEDHCEALDVDGRIILKLILEKWD